VARVARLTTPTRPSPQPQIRRGDAAQVRHPTPRSCR
jgi:hypothetical protein